MGTIAGTRAFEGVMGSTESRDEWDLLAKIFVFPWAALAGAAGFAGGAVGGGAVGLAGGFLGAQFGSWGVLAATVAGGAFGAGSQIVEQKRA